MEKTADPASMRKTSLELLRIIAMIFIIFHHYVVNSGLTDAGGPIASEPLSAHSIVLLLCGAWGKTAINCFVLFSGFFMCNKNITLRKLLKLLCEILFYSIVINTVFWASAYEPFSVKDFIKVFLPVRNLGTGFVDAYIVFFLSIPFLNIIIHNMTEKQHIKLLALLSFAYVFLGTLPGFSVLMNYFSWFAVLYFISSYIRLYPKTIFDNTKIWGISTLLLVIISSVSVVVMTWLGVKQNIGLISYEFVTDSNTLLAVLTGVSTFMYFKNINIPQSRFINTVASTTFGVLLIHANSDTMRRWLWKDIFNNVGNYYSPIRYIHPFAVVIGVFVICSLIDYLRIKLIEKPFFNYVDKKLPDVVSWYNRKEQQLFEKYNIH